MGSLVFQATLGGQVNLNGPNTASTFDIAVPATTGTMVTTGDSGTVTNTMLAASAYNTPGTIGSGTANTGAFTTLSASSTVSGTGFSTYLASPPAIGATTAAAGAFTTLSASSTVSGTGFSTYLASPPAIGGTAPAAGTFTSISVANTFNSASTFGFKNRIINGAMVIDQRNAGASVTPNSSYTLDRWASINSQTSKFTVQQNAASVTPPAGFANYLGVTSSSAYSVAAGDYFAIYQPIEGFNTADLAFGTASAATTTLSFWVRSSLTGTFGGALKNGAANRSYPFTYTISSANTWEQKSVTIAGDTSGTWVGATNGTGLSVQIGLGVGSTFSGTAGSWQGSNLISATGATSVVGTSGATFYITGIQLEKGSTATSFDYRPYGTELALCQRYFERLPAGGYGAVAVRTTDWYGYLGWQVEKRTNPTMTLNGTISILGNVGDITGQTPTGIDETTTKTTRIYKTGSAFTSQAGTFKLSSYLDASAEL
jgi:hypothetical protein